jgi:hypothetical protein
VISLPDCFHFGSNNNNNNTKVVVQILPTVMDASEILIEPLSYEDWDFMTIHAEWLENGGLLSQVCIVYPNQIIPLHLQQSNNNNTSNDNVDIAYVRVLQSNFEYQSNENGTDNNDTNDNTRSIWPDDDDNDVDEGKPVTTDNTNVQYHPCLRLVANTQIIVIPKERVDPTKSEQQQQYSPMLRIIPSFEDYSYSDDDTNIFEAFPEPQNFLYPVPVPSQTILVHPKTLSKMMSVLRNENKGNGSSTAVVRIKHCYSLIHSHPSDDITKTTFGKIQTSMDIPEGHVGTYV